MNAQYVTGVELLLRILPYISKEKDVAVHGGTAINLFYFEMPRLSVDIDLTFIPYGERDKDIKKISELLNRLRKQLSVAIPNIIIRDSVADKEEYKLFCSLNNNEIKIEINTINRGIYEIAEIKPLCKRAWETFNSFCEIQVVSSGQLFGGKIVAALDRQHPRDLFDTKHLLDKIGYTDEIKKGFIFALLSSKRPFHEILNPGNSADV